MSIYSVNILSVCLSVMPQKLWYLWLFSSLFIIHLFLYLFIYLTFPHAVSLIKFTVALISHFSLAAKTKNQKKIHYNHETYKTRFFNIIVKNFPVWLRSRLLSAGLEPVLSQTEKSCIASNYRQFSTNIKINIIILIFFILISAESCL